MILPRVGIKKSKDSLLEMYAIPRSFLPSLYSLVKFVYVYVYVYVYVHTSASHVIADTAFLIRWFSILSGGGGH